MCVCARVFACSCVCVCVCVCVRVRALDACQSAARRNFSAEFKIGVTRFFFFFLKVGAMTKNIIWPNWLHLVRA